MLQNKWVRYSIIAFIVWMIYKTPEQAANVAQNGLNLLAQAGDSLAKFIGSF